MPERATEGGVEAGYGPVADEFRRNFAERGEVGAACAVYRDGRKVVDLWGGYRDARSRDPWDRHTLVTVFSTTKGMTALALAVAHSRGLLDYDERVAAYWPAFAAAGKEAITVRQLLAHQAGLPAIDTRVEPAALRDRDSFSTLLARQRPLWEPGSRHGYHAVTLGWYESELLRHVDPDGRSIGAFFADEVAAALGIEFYIGLPDEVPDERVATLHGWSRREALRQVPELPVRFVLALLNPWSITRRALTPLAFLRRLESLNSRELLALEIPAVNGTGEVRALARAYGSVATGGHELGLRPETLHALVAGPTPPERGRRDVVLHTHTAYSLGFTRPSPAIWFGTPSGRAFGAEGAGGSFAFADPDTSIGFAYGMNRGGPRVFDDPRQAALRRALYRVIGA